MCTALYSFQMPSPEVAEAAETLVTASSRLSHCVTLQAGSSSLVTS